MEALYIESPKGKIVGTNIDVCRGVKSETGGCKAKDEIVVPKLIPHRSHPPTNQPSTKRLEIAIHSWAISPEPVMAGRLEVIMNRNERNFYQSGWDRKWTPKRPKPTFMSRIRKAFVDNMNGLLAAVIFWGIMIATMLVVTGSYSFVKELLVALTHIFGG